MLQRLKGTRLALTAVVLLLTLQSVAMAFAATANTPPEAPTALVLSIIPPKLPADGGVYPAVVVSLVDANSNPTAALNPITVFLTSSQPNFASVPDSVTIEPGQEYAIANVTTTATAGPALITAHAEGYGSPQDVSLTTVIPSGFPSKIVVFTSPSEFLPRNDQGVVRVEVVDGAGQPSKALSPIAVLLTSSNASVARIDQSEINIPMGTIFASGTFETSATGQAVISAEASGYQSGTASVSVDLPCSSSCGAYKLAFSLVPGVLPADGKSYQAVQIGLETQGGAPAVSSSDTIVQLASDQPGVASVGNLVAIPAGKISALTNVTTTALAGTANLTASAPGLVPATVQVNTIIPAPSKLQAYIAPPASAFSGSGNYPILVVQLQDSGGNPARARQSTSLIVTSSNGSLISNSLSLTIPQGSDYAFTYLQTTGTGASTLKVSSQGLVSSQVALTSKPGPLELNLGTSSGSNGIIFANQTALFTFTVSYVGTPLQDINVTWQASGGAILSPQSGSTGSSGSTSTVFTPPSFGKYNVTATAVTPQTGTISRTVSILVAQVPSKPAPSLADQILGYWYYLAAAVAVVVVAAVYLLRMRRKKQRAEIEAGFEVV